MKPFEPLTVDQLERRLAECRTRLIAGPRWQAEQLEKTIDPLSMARYMRADAIKLRQKLVDLWHNRLANFIQWLEYEIEARQE